MSTNAIIANFNDLSARISALKEERSAIEGQIEKLADEQIAIALEACRELKVDGLERLGHTIDAYRRYDRLEIRSDGTIEMWQNGRCGDPDEVLAGFTFHQLFIDGKHDEYCELIKSEIERHREMERIVKRNRLTNELAAHERTAARLREQLAAV